MSKKCTTLSSYFFISFDPNFFPPCSMMKFEHCLSYYQNLIISSSQVGETHLSMSVLLIMINFLQPKIFRVLLVTHSVPLTLTVTIFGCCAFNNVLISLNEVIGNPSRSFSIFKRFNATISSTTKRRKFKIIVAKQMEISVKIFV